MYLSDFIFFTFTLFIFVILGLLSSWEHIGHYTNWDKHTHTKLKDKLDKPQVVETSVRYEPPTKLEAEEIKKNVIKLHSKKPNGTKIMITIATHNRKGYTKFNADVIRYYHKIPSEELFIFDDCSTQYGEKELREWYGPNINYFPCTKKLLADSNIRRMFKYFSMSNYDIIFSVDSDTLFQSNWRSFILNNLNKTDGMMSLYHSAASWHKTYGCDTVLCKKKSLGSAGSVMTRDVVIKMLKNNKNKAFDWGFVGYFVKMGMKMVVPKKSIMFHYGKHGQNNGCNTQEVAKDFERNLLPKWIQNALVQFFDKCSSPNTILDNICDHYPNVWEDKKMEKEFIEILSYFNNTMLDNDIDYSVAFGTALGLARWNDFIYWDDDMDVMVKSEDTEKAKHFIRKPFCTANFWGGWKIFKCDTVKTSKYVWGWPFIDVFDFGHENPTYTYKIPKDFFPSKPVKIHGLDLRGPNKLEKHMTQKYGKNYMNNCVSNHWDHLNEKSITKTVSYNCKEVIKHCLN